MNDIQIKAIYSVAIWFRSLSPLVIILLTFSLSFADDTIGISGKLDLRGVKNLTSDSVREEPSLIGRIKLDTRQSAWRFHSWLEGGWDGTMKRPARDRNLFKNYDEVYQSNTPYLEFKELYFSHTTGDIEIRAGIQRFAWGRLDEYPSNDLLNPWDYTQFLRKPLEDRKIGVPSVSASVNTGDWTFDTVWVPVFVPYRLPLPNERWSGISEALALSQIPNGEIVPAEPDLPPRTIANSGIGLRARRAGDLEWALNGYHGYDPKPVFRTTSIEIVPLPGAVLIDPGYTPDFHKITSLGFDAAVVTGDWSVRAEAAYIMNRYFNIRRELWGYPAIPAPGAIALNPIEQKSDALDYGIGADYRLFEDGLLTMQAQQTIIIHRLDTFYERRAETILWANLKAGWMNQKMETNVSIACNPEHGATMAKVNAWYVFTDSWKAGISVIDLNGPPQSIFGRYAQNDQVEAELVYSW
ncbi:MAG: hypothetical protein M0R70_00470 [Nitrospirae bacterium]|nr:hypothetical protein [Nitrospirota bacterium]